MALLCSKYNEGKIIGINDIQCNMSHHAVKASYHVFKMYKTSLCSWILWWLKKHSIPIVKYFLFVDRSDCFAFNLSYLKSLSLQHLKLPFARHQPQLLDKLIFCWKAKIDFFTYITTPGKQHINPWDWATPTLQELSARVGLGKNVQHTMKGIYQNCSRQNQEQLWVATNQLLCSVRSGSIKKC